MGSSNSTTYGFDVSKSLKTPEYSLKIRYNKTKSMTKHYKGKVNVFRRGTYFVLHFKYKKKQEYKNLDVIINPLNSSKPTENDIVISKNLSYFEILKEVKKNNKVLFTINIKLNAAVGFYQLFIVDGEIKITDILLFYIVFNPFHQEDDVYTKNKDFIDDYLFHTKTVVHIGSEDNYSHKIYNLDQFSFECLLINWKCIYRMEILDRECPLKVSKAISDFINNDNENGLMSTKFCDIINGRHPFLWTKFMDIYKEYLSKEKSVNWGCFFLFECLVTAMCRCIGIVCRTVTGFSIDPYKDTDESKVILSGKDLTIIEKNISLWNFNCWNTIILKSKIFIEDPSIISNDSFWYQLDKEIDILKKENLEYKPRLLSEKNEILKDGYINRKYVNKACKYGIRYIIVYEDEKTVIEFIKNYCGKLFLTSNRKKNTINITHEYKEITNLVNKYPIMNKISIELNVDKLVKLGNTLKYSFKIRNSIQDSKSLVCISLKFINQHGLNLLDEEKSKSIEFRNKDMDFNEEFHIMPIIDSVDLSEMCYLWELRFLNKSLSKLKIIRKTTAIRPLLSAIFFSHSKDWTAFSIGFSVSVKNQSKYSLKDVHIVIYFEKNIDIRKEFYLDFEENQIKHLSVNFDGISLGIVTFLGIASYGLSVFKIGEVSEWVDV